MNNDYLNAIRNHGKTLISHIALVDGSGSEPTGGSPAYARMAVTWADDGNGVMRPNANIAFDIPAGFTVAGWRGFSASTGGTNYGGAALTAEAYAGQGVYTLLAASTGVLHSAA